MAQYQNGPNSFGQYDSSQQRPANQYGEHYQHPNQSQYVRRTPSFDSGDDTAFQESSFGGPSNRPGQAGWNAERGTETYRSSSNARRQNEELFMGPTSSGASQSGGMASYGSSPNSYERQYQPQASPPTTAYNPQQFARTSSQYQPQAYNNISNQRGSVHQPYNPAAYQSPTVQRHSSHAAQSYGYSSNSYTSSSPYSSPGLISYAPASPPLPQDPQHQFGRVSSQHGTRPSAQYTNYLPSQHTQYSPGPPRVTSLVQPPPPPPRSSVYTAPAPPPPPFPPASESFSPDDYGALHSQSDSGNRLSYSQHSQHSHPNAVAASQHRLPPIPSYPNTENSGPLGNLVSRATESSLYAPTNAPPPLSGPRPPQHSPQRSDTIGRPLPARPLPGPPTESDTDSDYFESLNGNPQPQGRTAEQMAQEDIWKEVEAAVMNTGSGPGAHRRSPRIEISHQSPVNEGAEPQSLFSRLGNQSQSQNGAQTNGHLSAEHRLSIANYSDESDAEAAAGLAAMRLAEEQEAADDARRESGGGPMFGTYGSHLTPQHGQSVAEPSSDSDYANIDMGLYGGGYEGHLSYGAESQDYANLSELEDQSRPLPTPGSMRRLPASNDGLQDGMYDYSIPDQDAIHPFPSFGARVDTFGTGGLSEPSPHKRKLSFDEGDEVTLVGSEAGQTSGSQSPTKEEMPELFYHPGMSPSAQRPLPPAPVGSLAENRIPQLMPAGTYQNQARYQHYEQPGRPSYPPAPDDLHQAMLSPSGSAVPRSSSLISHSSTPQMVPPIRSKTDAEERRARYLKQQLQSGVRSSVIESEAGYDSSAPQSTVALDLPAIPVGKRKKFNPAKLSSHDFKKCAEPWALSAIAAWVKEMSEDEVDLKENAIVDGIVALFTHKVPTMNTADAETLGARVVSEMFKAEALVHDEEWVKFGAMPISGVIWQLSGSGCYAPRLHTQTMPGRCYAHHCSRTLKKINLQTQVIAPQRKLEDWTTFYNLKKEDTENVSKKDIERQNNLHEIVQTEDQFMDQINVLRVLYRDQLLSWQPPIITPKRVQSFIADVFGKVEAVKKANEDFLLAQLKYRQQEQGPWIVGFSDIFREWIRKAKNAYIDYAASFPNASFLVRKESERNILFRQFLDQVRENEQSKRLGWDTYLKAPITRLQRYSLLLSTVHKNMIQDSEEKTNLQAAIEEIKVVTHECDSKVAEMSKKVDLMELGSKLILRPGMERVELNLNHLGRELIFQGDLQRAGANRFTWLETHAILFDHYLVLAKTVSQRDAAGGLKYERYDVSKLPIPMDLLVLESTSDDPVQKQAVKGIGALTTVTSKAQNQADPRLNRTISGQSTGPGTLAHTNTSSSISSVNTTSSGKTLVSNTVLEGPNEKIMFPFRVKHLGKSEVYTLYAPSASNRQDWCEKILEAKTKHAASLFAQNAEPFRLRIMADTAFGYDTLTGGPKSFVIKGTPLDRAIREVERTFENAGSKPPPICRAAVNCATAFAQPYPGKPMVAVGTDYGVYVCEQQNPRGWTRAIPVSKVMQIAVLEEFSLFLVLTDKSLVAHHLDLVCSANGMPTSSDSARKAPQKLSGQRDVGFFATGRMKDRTLVFFKKRDGLSSTFKVLEPIFQKATEKKSRFSRKGTTEFFRDYDDFYIPTECFSINLFHSSLAISTSRGFEVLTLDKKQPWSVPDLKQPHVATIASRLSGQRPLGMFRLSDTEFLLCYEECAVYVNKHGDVSRSVIMEFVGKAKSAALYGPYVLLFDPDFVEIRNAQNGRLRQVIAGRDVKCLDDAQSGGSAGNRTIKISLQHPEIERVQIVAELLLNEGQKE